MEAFRKWWRPVQRVSREHGFPAGKVMFRPQPFWQKLREDHIAPAGTVFKMGMEDGINYGKLKCDTEVEADSKYAMECAKVLDFSNNKGDTDALASLLRTAAADNDVLCVRTLLQSCYVTQPATAPAVCEAAKSNNKEVLSLLLGAGASAACNFSTKPALHFALEAGSEACAQLLIDQLTADQVHKQDVTGRCAFISAKEADLGPLSNRLLDYATKQGKARPDREEVVHQA